MTVPNLERFVNEYIAGEMSTTNLDIKCTYCMYDELLSLLSTRSTNIQQALNTNLPILHKDVMVPSMINNITHAFRKHIDSGNNMDEIISYLFPPQKNENEISSFCTEAGISVDNLSKEQPLKVSPKYLTNQLVYDLERYRQMSNMLWSEAVKWHQKLFPLDQKVTYFH